MTKNYEDPVEGFRGIEFTTSFVNRDDWVFGWSYVLGRMRDGDGDGDGETWEAEFTATG